MDIGAEIAAALAESMTDEEYVAMFSPQGLARQALWHCADGWIVGYTSERIRGGTDDGKFAAMAYKPQGKGARSGEASQHVRVYYRTFAKRKTARARAEALYHQHNERARR
jgi:hypothetical protein